MVEVTVGDMARAYGVEEAGGGSSAPVQLRLDPVPDLTSDWFLTVGAQDGTSGSVGQYLTRYIPTSRLTPPVIGLGTRREGGAR